MAAGALGCVLTSQITVTDPWVRMCVVLDVAVQGSRLIWLERSPFSLGADSGVSDGPCLKGVP